MGGGVAGAMQKLVGGGVLGATCGANWEAMRHRRTNVLLCLFYDACLVAWRVACTCKRGGYSVLISLQ